MITRLEHSDKITAAIINLVAQDIAQRGGEFDLDATMRGISSAFAAFAYAYHMPEEATRLLADLSHLLDDRETLEWALTARANTKGFVERLSEI